MNGYSDSDLVWVACAYCRRNRFRVLKSRIEQNNYCGMHCRDSGIVGGYRWAGTNLPIANRDDPSKLRRGVPRRTGKRPGRKPKALANEIEREIADGAPPPGEEEAPTRLEQIKEIEQEVDTLDILSHQRELS